jgi:hypothetical protein
MIKITCLFPLAQSPGLGSLESLQEEQHLDNDHRKQAKTTNEKSTPNSS